MKNILEYIFISMLLLAVLLFGYYAAYELALPFSNGWLPPVAGALLGICALVSSRSLPSRIPSAGVGWLEDVTRHRFFPEIRATAN